ncbi:MAG: hypothetical protein Q9160_005614 [Pyrenula sp. 1 TL-2023]
MSKVPLYAPAYYLTQQQLTISLSVNPSDTIVPLNPSDDTAILRSVCLVILHRYDDVLDPEKLRYSLERLVDRDGWRKIGGRLRLNV